jgi:hypothetical protein
VTWDNISGEGGVSALTGVQVYCDPAVPSGTTTVQVDASCTEVPNVPDADVDADVDADIEAGLDDAGTTTVCTDGGTETVPGPACFSPNFASTNTTDGGSGQIIPDANFNAQYLCGSITGNTGSTVIASSLRGQPLANGTTYAVSVAGTDAYGNVGALSAPICEFPEQTNDFFENYRRAGGQAGGGFCSTTGPGMASGTFATFGIVIAAVLSSLRRRWKKDRR